jgi:hypothetical protein
MDAPFNVDGGENVSTSASKPEEITRRRGRPFGSRNRDPLQAQSPPPTDAAGSPQGASPKPRKRRSKPVDLGELAKKIQGTHMMLAIMTGLTEMQVTEAEATMLAGALADCAREFDMAPNGKAVAVVQLLGVSAIIYLPRVALLKAKIDAKKRERPVTVDENGKEVPNGPPAAH